MLGYHQTSDAPAASTATPPAEVTTGSAGPTPAPEEKKDAPEAAPTASSEPAPTTTVTGAQTLTHEPLALNVVPPSPPAPQQITQPIRVFVESRGTQTLRPPTPPSASFQRGGSQSRNLSIPAPVHLQDPAQPSSPSVQYNNASPVRRSSRNYPDHLPPLPESVHLPPPVRSVLPNNGSGSNFRTGGDAGSDHGSREADAEPPNGRVRSGQTITHARPPRNSTYDEKEFGMLDKEKATNNTSISRGTTLVDKHFSYPFSAAKHSSTSRKTLAERLQPTLDTAISQRTKYVAKARRTGLTLNTAIGAQVLLGALVTGLSAVGSGTGKSTGTATAVLGGFSTLVASYLARARGSNEPELSITRVKDLEHFTRECESFMMDYGHIVVGDEDENDPVNRELEQRMFRLRDRFEELLGNASGERKLSPPV